jgi:extradiol dioxygenase family protein
MPGVSIQGPWDARKAALLRTGWTSISNGRPFACHLNPELGKDRRIPAHYNAVDGHGVSMPHCGVVLEMMQRSELADRLRRHGVDCVIEPSVRFKGEPGEQAAMVLLDPSGNALEFKSFRDIPRQLFAT